MAKKADGTEEVSTETNEISTTADGITSTEQPNIEVVEVVFVVMERDPEFYDAPHSAQVHPEEVKNFYSGGWLEKKPEAE